MLGISSIGTLHGTTLPILCGFFSAKIIRRASGRHACTWSDRVRGRVLLSWVVCQHMESGRRHVRDVRQGYPYHYRTRAFPTSAEKCQSGCGSDATSVKRK